jgi:hypothetical protein
MPRKIITIIIIIIPKPRLKTRAIFGFVTLVPVISSPERINFALEPFCRAYSPSYRNHPRQDSNPGHFLGVVATVPVISSPKQATLVLAPFFYRAYFPSNRNHLHRQSNSGQFLGVAAFVYVISSSKQATLVPAPWPFYLPLCNNNPQVLKYWRTRLFGKCRKMQRGKLFQITCFHSQVFQFFYLERTVTALHSLHYQ